jgi:ATP-dependent DNA helicase RecG
MNLSTPLTGAGRAFSMYASRLEKLNITTLQDLLQHFPSRYDDFSIVTPTALAQNGEVVTIQGTVASTQNVYTRSRFQIQRVEVSDETGSMECTWFNQPYILRMMHVGDSVSISGRVEQLGAKKSLSVKEYEVLKEGFAPIHTATLVPIYPETRGVTSRWFRNRIKTLIDSLDSQVHDFLPTELITTHQLLDLTSALQTIHFPKSYDEAQKARERLAYDELFLLQLGAFHRKNDLKQKKVTHSFESTKHTDKLTEFYTSLPFELTGAQKRAVDEMLSDMGRPTPMNRLLQGDVGSGKTIVAAVGMYISYLNGFQSVIMAPTQILAEQHYESIKRILEPFGVAVELVRGGGKKSNKLLPTAHPLSPNILIGTHALLHHEELFENLGFVVIDEQHRFGVEQRGILRDWGNNPHFLTMTATPIPRTVFLTMYGDLEISFLDELPKGRQRIKTWLVPNFKREAAYDWIKKTISDADEAGNWNQVFIVCPFIEESESMQTVKAATKEYERLKKDVFPKYKMGLLHGKMKAAEKQATLLEFQKGELDILVSTPVVEVGIDIPNATIMVIEAAERFGLASLHQLRGRVGRNSRQSYCLIFTQTQSEATAMRLKSLETTHTGAALAEIDLKRRGAGDIFGTQQHGYRMLKVADFGDTALIHKTQQDARTFYTQLDKYPILQEKLKSTIIQKVNPD